MARGVGNSDSGPLELTAQERVSLAVRPCSLHNPGIGSVRTSSVGAVARVGVQSGLTSVSKTTCARVTAAIRAAGTVGDTTGNRGRPHRTGARTRIALSTFNFRDCSRMHADRVAGGDAVVESLPLFRRCLDERNSRPADRFRAPGFRGRGRAKSGRESLNAPLVCLCYLLPRHLRLGSRCDTRTGQHTAHTNTANGTPAASTSPAVLQFIIPAADPRTRSTERKTFAELQFRPPRHTSPHATSAHPDAAVTA